MRELDSGRVVHGWRVEEQLGRGAMAVVYRVRHEELGTLAALKVLDRIDPVTEHRLLQEGRAQGSIHHPGIVSVLDFVRIDGHSALLLEYVPGSDLAALLSVRSLSLEEGLDLFRQVVAAVAAAHAAGLVHRDLKPSNVLVMETPRGLVAKVGDFGLVKSEQADLTVTHALVGTPKYMAPEQMRAARTVDARADLFALGCVLYELVCGRPPFPGDDLVELYTAKTGGHYAVPDRLVPELPRAVVHAITGCLEGAVGRRVPSCGTLLAVLGGAPWCASAGSDDTLDVGRSSWLCPACGAAVPTDSCPACSADPSLAGRYRLVDVLSVGVWRALDLREGRWVVVKGLRGADRERFDRGARVARELDHPQIARGLAPPFDEHGRRWEVRELVEGASLADMLAAHRFDEGEVLELVQQLAAPLRYLAGRSPPVVHRALSPSHVIRAEDGRLVLIDFGQAHDVRGDGSLHDRPDGAPELWVGEATPAADVFGLGGLAVTLLTRRAVHELRVGERIAFEDQVTASEPTKALLRTMLAPEAAHRPTIDQVATRAGRIASDLRRPLEIVDAPVARRRRALPVRLGIAGGALFALGAPVVLCGGALFLLILDGDPERAEPSPERLREAGADLAERRVAGADCGRPFDQRIVLHGELPVGTRVPLGLERTCNGTVRPLGDLPVGVETVVSVPGTGALRIPWAEARCGPDPSRSGPCELPGDPQDAVHVWLTAPPTQLRVTDPMGAPVAGAEIVDVGVDGLAAARVSDADGTVVFPWGFDGRYALVVDGIARRTTLGDAEIVVATLGEVSEVEVVDAALQPLSGVHVRCRAGGEPSEGTVGRTDPSGRLRCDTPADEDRWAEVSMPGFVAVTTRLGATTRVVLEPARTIHVGCAGYPGGRCTHLDSPLGCVGVEGPSGACRFVRDRLVCDCAPGADRLVHGVVGTAELRRDSDQVWIDLRELRGAIEGWLPEAPVAPAACEVRLSTSKGALRAGVDELGRFVFAGVPYGSYTLTASCPDGSSYTDDVFVEGQPTRVTFDAD